MILVAVKILLIIIYKHKYIEMKKNLYLTGLALISFLYSPNSDTNTRWYYNIHSFFFR